MGSSEAELMGVVAILTVVLGYGCPFVIVTALVYWVGTRSKRAMARGQLALTQGRMYEAFQAFEVVNDRQRYRGQAALWLWRLSDARHDLDGAASLFERKYELEIAPYLALVATLRGDRDATDWLLLSNDSPLAEAKLAQAVAALRRKAFDEAKRLVPAQFPNPRAAKLGEVIVAFADANLDGQARSIDAAGLLGEGSIDGLKRAWPELANALELGRVEPLPPAA